MSNKTKLLWVDAMCCQLADIEQETLGKLGKDKGGFFVNVANDCIDINSAIRDTYCGQHNLVLHTSLGIFKEVEWFHFFFVSGNYPLLLGRLRFVWESVFRAFFAENYPFGTQQRGLPVPGQSLHDKLGWLNEHERKLNWDRCMVPVLRKIFPLADGDQEVRDCYKSQWQELHKYVHPSSYLSERMVGESALHITDGFDEKWALETIEISSKVFDLVWLAILGHHPLAFGQMEKVCGEYPILKAVFEKQNH